MSLTKHPNALGHVASGNHIKVAANDEPELAEADLIEADLAYNQDKAARLARENDRRALEIQINQGGL